MRYFRYNDDVFAFDHDEAEKHIKDGMTELTRGEVNDLIDKSNNISRIAELKRLLAESDFYESVFYQARSGKSDSEMQIIYAKRDAWYSELQKLIS